MKGDPSANSGIEIIADCCGNTRGNIHTLCLLAHLISQVDGMIWLLLRHKQSLRVDLCDRDSQLFLGLVPCTKVSQQ